MHGLMFSLYKSKRKKTFSDHLSRKLKSIISMRAALQKDTSTFSCAPAHSFTLIFLMHREQSEEASQKDEELSIKVVCTKP